MKSEMEDLHFQIEENPEDNKEDTLLFNLVCSFIMKIHEKLQCSIINLFFFPAKVRIVSCSE